MTHPIFWPNKIFFYPIGNTPAVCFTCTLPPEQPADMLLLGCGDARNVLYTVYADLGASGARNLDFTCCDSEPAVLARNVLLYTLVADLPSDNADEHISKIWNLYYHFFIDKGTLDTILKQCHLLVDLSTDLTRWNNSKYGAFLRVCTAHTLAALRRHWALYIEMQTFPKAKKDALRNEFGKRRSPRKTREHTKTFEVSSLTRPAGPLWPELGKMATEHHNRYWTAGVTFEDAKVAADANQVNPTFAYSSMGLGFDLHYGSDPLQSFHIAQGLAPLKGLNANKPNLSSLVKSAMDEFNGWCRAFNSRLKLPSAALVIRMFVGDALFFCRALHQCSVIDSVDTGVYTMPWSSTLIVLDKDTYTDGATLRAPLKFHVIDTSNLTDHLGLLNILIASRPLMQAHPSSVLHTNTLVTSDEKALSGESFLDRLCGDITMLSMVLDLIPVSYVSNFMTNSNGHEILMLSQQDASSRPTGSSLAQFHEQISWRIGSMSNSEGALLVSYSSQRLTFDEEQLAGFLHNVFLKMFSSEDVGAMLQPNFSLGNLRDLSSVHYTRTSFAYFLRIVKSEVQVNWGSVINLLEDKFCGESRLSARSNYMQDLFCNLHLLDIHSFSPFIPGFNDALSKDGVLKGWKQIPAVVCITFQVPREKFQPLGNWEEIPIPTLECILAGRTALNSFQNFQGFFGTITANYKGRCEEPCVTFEESPKGFLGSSPVILTFQVPTWLLGIESSSLRVSVSVRASPLVSMKLLPVLGPYLTLFSAQITDRNHVHITRERPGNLGELSKLRMPVTQSASPNSGVLGPIKIILDSCCKQAATLAGRANIVEPAAKEALSKKCTNVEICQTSSQAVCVSFGKYRQIVPYPFPIDSISSKTRIARKSSYIEVEVSIFKPGGKSGMSINPFPIIKYKGGMYLWNVHYIDLDRVPALDRCSGKRLDFVSLHVAMAFSAREHRICKATVKANSKDPAPDVITRVKQTINDLFVTASGAKGAHHSVFALADPENGGVYTLIFVNDLRLDLASHAIVVDAAVLPLTVAIVDRMSSQLYKVHSGGLITIKTDAEEVKAWKHLLPAFTERCRKWKHTAHCEYLSKGVPVSEEMESSPLCSCGKGKNLGPFLQKNEWKHFAPYSTRVAIGPLFSVPFVDPIGEYLSGIRGGVKPDITTCAKCGGQGKPKLLVCGACKNISYCSTECQKGDWKSHKKQCKN